MEPLASRNGIPPYSTLSSGSDDASRDSATHARGKGRSVQLLLDRIDEIDATPQPLGSQPQGAVDEFKAFLVGVVAKASPAEVEQFDVDDPVAATAPPPPDNERAVATTSVSDVTPIEVDVSIDPESELSLTRGARADLAMRYQDPPVNPLGAEVDTLA